MVWHEKIHQFFTRTNKVVVMLYFVLFNILLGSIFSTLARTIGKHDLTKNFKNFSSPSEAAVLVIIVAPILETLIFQVGIIETMKKKRSLTVVCFISAFFFALLHCYNVYYFLCTFTSGLLMAYLYCLGNTFLRGFLLVVSMHMIYNSFVFLVNYF